ncbi:purine nucleoside permease [Zopfia rhizophila CBS 207.26]|uniref:Purine nucleoside permease n=1 Tax=Zopfia rhizophila CBS 207.26 TaxID=1314779 RepID=A0A6A6E5Z9_9PEZI|nr:purine nucleoside permease [Zopfia rhizophila CBS 207.26]
MTYSLLIGIACENPRNGTFGDVIFAKFVLQVDLQLEFDALKIPSVWTTAYIFIGAESLGSYPKIIYGTEVFELNDNLRKMALVYASEAHLEDSPEAWKDRA